jgi:hypothetical protein
MSVLTRAVALALLGFGVALSPASSAAQSIAAKPPGFVAPLAPADRETRSRA